MAFNQFMHPRNRYKDNRPNFAVLAEKYPEFKRHLSSSLTGKVSLDFKDPEALRALTCTLLTEDFGISLEIPLDRIIPTVPLRLNYILWIEDLLTESGRRGSEVICGIDIGCGASCIYPILGAKLNSWHFTASEVDQVAAGFAKLNIKENNLHHQIQVFEANPDDMLCGVVKAIPRLLYHFTMCNPPFFGNLLEAQGIMTSRTAGRSEPTSISTASEGEMIWDEGGEVEFVKRMIADSLKLREQVVWYTTMVGKKASLAPLKQELAEHKIRNVTTTEFCQGRTMRWGIAWTFYQDIDPPKSPAKKLKRDKERPPLIIQVPELFVQYVLQEVKSGGSENQRRVNVVAKAMEKMLAELEIDFKPKLGPKQTSCYTLTASKNTWSNQRRKRRRKLQTCRYGGEESVAISMGSGQSVAEPSQHAAGSSQNATERTQVCRRDVERRLSFSEVDEEAGSCSRVASEGDTRRGVDPKCKNNNGSSFVLDQPGGAVVGLAPKTSKSKEIGTDSSSSEAENAKKTGLVLKCDLTIRVTNGQVRVEMSWTEGKSRESMHQVGQYFKNQFKQETQVKLTAS